MLASLSAVHVCSVTLTISMVAVRGGAGGAARGAAPVLLVDVMVGLGPSLPLPGIAVPFPIPHPGLRLPLT